jgi:hypothetical protein
MEGSNENHGRSMRPGAEDRGWSSIGPILGGRAIERSGDVVCSLHRAHGDEERGFLGTVSLSLASKAVAMVFLVEHQNQGRRVSQFGPQNRQLWFGDLGLKIITTVSWFGPQN